MDQEDESLDTVNVLDGIIKQQESMADLMTDTQMVEHPESQKTDSSIPDDLMMDICSGASPYTIQQIQQHLSKQTETDVPALSMPIQPNAINLKWSKRLPRTVAVILCLETSVTSTPSRNQAIDGDSKSNVFLNYLYQDRSGPLEHGEQMNGSPHSAYEVRINLFCGYTASCKNMKPIDKLLSIKGRETCSALQYWYLQANGRGWMKKVGTPQETWPEFYDINNFCMCIDSPLTEMIPSGYIIMIEGGISALVPNMNKNHYIDMKPDRI
ncbi:hypothetical protein BDK51DRAFT_38836 [Blyttiomyces helicus]|uniref:Uncharacterized protein n=1 Tax=Blyttiomyces helicus TaxID=388810 RepID=A0A4P9WQT6_9FUNG|nr:hypothetical protein BDK51DRAFT_38836 [Blyttiomyces helicus]|eukprot:RKO94553.1 hypothetical protein BDK51DRAFT_38836 [Blyttiomyces helicus]